MAIDPVMEPVGNSLGRIAATSKRFARLLLTIGENRLELLKVALQEKRGFLLRVILLSLGMGIFGLLAGMTLTAAVAVYFWAYSPVVVLLSLAALYGLIVLIMAWCLKRRLRNFRPLSTSLDQLQKDRAELEEFFS